MQNAHSLPNHNLLRPADKALDLTRLAVTYCAPPKPWGTDCIKTWISNNGCSNRRTRKVFWLVVRNSNLCIIWLIKKPVSGCVNNTNIMQSI